MKNSTQTSRLTIRKNVISNLCSENQFKHKEDFLGTTSSRICTSSSGW
jgi:hypothetical protein